MQATQMKMSLRSPSFSEGAPIPARHTCDGANVSPELQWNRHDQARSYVLVVSDPDAPSGTFMHWVLFDIPAQTARLEEGVSGIGVAGRNDFQRIGYGGPCPPPNHGKHRYFFRLYALDVDSLKAAEGASWQDIEAELNRHTIDQSQLMGVYERRSG